MVKRLKGLIFILLGFSTAAHAALEVNLDKKQSQLGEPLGLQIRSTEDLSALDLSPITRHFELANQTMNRASRQGQDVYLLEVTLYPLRSGVLTVPRLAMGTMHSRAVEVLILPAKVSIQAWFPPSMPMEREATVLHLELRDDGSSSWNTPIELDAPYTAIRALPELVREEWQGDTKSVVHHFRWQILPLKAGNVTVRFGMVDAYRYAQRLRFPVGNISLKVRSAPAYLPLSLPIGQPIIRADPTPKNLIADKLQAWNMYVSAPGLSAEGLNSLLQYSVPDGVHIYPPSVSADRLDTDEYLRVTLSYRVERSARIFPAIRLPYFDMRTQRIETMVLPAAPLHVRDLARERLLAWIATVTGLGLLAILSWVSWGYWRRIRTKHKWLIQVSASQTPAELYTQLTKHSPWRVCTLRNLPKELNINANQYAELDALRFGRMDVNRFPMLKSKLTCDIAKTAIKFYPQDFLHS